MHSDDLKAVMQLRHELHRKPELSCCEKDTCRKLLATLQEIPGIDVEDRNGWVCAVWHGGNRKIAFRADMDALPMEETINIPHGSQIPGISHKCGHDGHCAALVGLAKSLSRYGCRNTVYLLFQRGEEIGAGGEELAQFVRKEQIQEVYAFHNWSGFPAGCVLTREGVSQCASLGLSIRMIGHPAHAGCPEDGANPAFALSKLALWVRNETSESEEFLLATVVGLEAGGQNFGMAAAEGALHLTLRAEQERSMLALKDSIIEKAAVLAAEDGLHVTYETVDVFPETRNHPQAVERIRTAAMSQGVPYAELTQPLRPSEDFGHLTKVCRGAMFYLGNGENYPSIHTAQYDFPDFNLETAADLFYAIAADGN